MKLLYSFFALLILSTLLLHASFSEELDFRPYQHGEVRKNSYTFFCLMETGGRHIVKIINRYQSGKISTKQAGDKIREKVIVYKCNRQKLIHMSLETIIQGTIPDFETVNGTAFPITKNLSLLKAQAKNGLIVYVITNALVPPPGTEKKKSVPHIAIQTPERKENRKKPPKHPPILSRSPEGRVDKKNKFRKDALKKRPKGTEKSEPVAAKMVQKKNESPEKSNQPPEDSTEVVD